MNEHPGFCDECGVSLDLHPSWPDPPEDLDFECRIADQKAHLIESFGGLLGRPS